MVLADAVAVLQSNSGAWTLLGFFLYQLYLNSVVPPELHETKLHAWFRRSEQRQDKNEERLLAQMQVLTAIAAVLPHLDTAEVRDYMEENGVDPLKDFVKEDVGDIVTEQDISRGD